MFKFWLYLYNLNKIYKQNIFIIMKRIVPTFEENFEQVQEGKGFVDRYSQQFYDDVKKLKSINNLDPLFIQQVLRKILSEYN